MTPLKSQLQSASATGQEQFDSRKSADDQELIEWRDLQDAQIDSMKHVWDNPEDEVWNDA